VIVWPDETERIEIGRRIGINFGFRQCVGFIDGAYVTLYERPTDHGEDYFTRKSCYALNCLFVCDDQKRILYMYVGWPGSAHDNRLWRNSKLFKEFKNFFSIGQYLVGDSAFSPSDIMIAAFKKSGSEGILNQEKEFFNHKLSQGRIYIEHTIGILKARFPCLKSLSVRIKGKKSLSFALNIINACGVLHNLLLSETDPIPDEWYEDIDDILDEDVGAFVPEDIYAAQQVNTNEPNDSKRNSLLQYIIDKFY